MKQFSHLIFGYGSLICRHSRSLTAPTLAQRETIPIVAKNIERTWSKRSKRQMTAMGVRFREDARCLGVLLPVDEKELAQFDEREEGYDRVALNLSDVHEVDFLNDDDHYNNEASKYFFEAKENDHVKIWVYVPQKTVPPSEKHPIVQSYVDTILRGCLTISEDFAKEFIETTVGWNAQELESINQHQNGECKHEEDIEGVYWLNDRQNPIYSRGDQDYMLKNGRLLDELLEEHLPVEVNHRRTFH